MSEVGVGEPQVLDAVGRVLRGETEAFELIVRTYQSHVLRICRAVVGTREDAEDAAQEVFYRTFRSLSSFRLDRRFAPWIAAIAVNTAKSYYRKRGRITKGVVSSETDLVAADGSVEEAGERAVLEESIRTAVQSLPEKLRGVVVLYYLEEMDVAEVAEALSLGKENVKSRLHRARARLRDILARDATDAVKRG